MSAATATRAETSVEPLTPAQAASTEDLVWNYRKTVEGLDALRTLRPLPADKRQYDGEVDRFVEQLGAILAELTRRRKAASKNSG